MSTPFRLLIALLFGGYAVAGSASAQYAPPADPPQPELVQARARRELAAWQAKLPASRPRLFFNAESWLALRSRYAAARGAERAYFDAALARARQIAERPVPVYRSPAEMMQLRPGLTLPDAGQELWQRPVGDNIVALSFALALQDNPAIRAKLHETVLAACAYPQWGATYPNQDLSAGHIGRGIAIAYDWHPEIWTEADRNLIRATIRTRMEAMKAATYGGIFWSGRYDENHNHVSVAGLGLCGLAFLDEIPEAAEWTALALTNFERVAHESHADGSSDEGIPYWSYGLSFTLQYIEGTRHVLGTNALYAEPFFRHTIENRLHASTPDLAGALPWGDAPARDYNGPHHLLYRLAAEYRDGTGQNLAGHLPFPPGGTDGLVWTALWSDPTVPETAPTALDRHATIGGLVTSRSGWGDGDYLLAFKAGFTNRNHSHLDAGALAFCFGHDWLMTTPGYGHGSGESSYWDKSGGRWTYQSNATEAESTLLINGRNQRFTADARGVIDSYVSSPDWCWSSADLSAAYEDVTRVRRDVLHRRGDYILVLDEVVAPVSAKAEWLLQVPPGAQVAGDQVTISARAGSLAIRSLLPAKGPFAVRPPTSLHQDVGPERLKTYALSQSGTTLHFAVVLAPCFGRTPPHLKSTGGTETTGNRKLVLVGEGWEDQVTVSSAADAPARVLATRRSNGAVDSILAIACTAVEAGGLKLHFTTAVDLALQLTPTGAWVIDAGTPFQLSEPPPAGWRIAALKVGSGAAEERLSAGRYVLLPTNQDPGVVQDWLRQPLATRAAPAAP